MKKILTLILIISLLFSFGCVRKDGEGDGKTSGEAFRFSGNNGLTVEFETGAPPSKNNWINKPIKIILEVTNKGSVNLESGEIKAQLKGVAATDAFESTKTQTSNEETLLSAEQELTPTYVTIDMGTITYTPEEMISAQIEPEIKTEICFPYITKTVSNNLLMSDNPNDFGSDNEIKVSLESSAAPVQVENFKESLAGDEIFIEFEVKNAGKGEVASTCFPGKDDIAKVEVEINEPDGISCETLDGGGSGDIELIEGKYKKVRCSIKAPEDESYETPLLMELNYKYDIELPKKITIKNTAR